MITNMLDKDVLYNDKECKICAVYQIGDGSVMFGVADEDGKLHFGLQAWRFTLNNPCVYTVVLYWTPERKIHAIKTVRELTGIGLKEAKDLVEGNVNGVKVKTKLTKAEAGEAVKVMEANGLEGRIVKE